MSRGDEVTEDARSWRDHIAEQQKFAARFLEADFEVIASKLGVATKILRAWLLPALHLFLVRCTGGEAPQTRERRARHLKERAKAAAALLSSLETGDFLNWPSDLAEEPFGSKFLAVLEALANPAPQTSPMGRPQKMAFRELVRDLVRIYERTTGEVAERPGSKLDTAKTANRAHVFIRDVRRLLSYRLPEARKALPVSEDALAQELVNHWPDLGKK